MYNTIPAVREQTSDNTKVVGVVGLVCVTLGVTFGLVASSAVAPTSGQLYATVSTPAAVRPLVSAPLRTRPVVARAASFQNQDGRYEEYQVPLHTAVNEMGERSNVTNLALVASGFGMAALAAVAAFAKRVTKVSNEVFNLKNIDYDPLGVERAQRIMQAEHEWAMMSSRCLIGNLAPDFEATAVFDEEFVPIKLSDYRGAKYVVLFFYPLDWTFVCPTEITAFSDAYGRFEELNAEVLGVSVDSQFSHLAWIQTPRNEGGLGELNYPLVADLKREIAKDFGVLVEEEGVALRGLFIIDKEGVIQHSTINNLAFGRSVDETIRTLEAIQHVQSNPDEVCPAGWKKGDKTMIPSPEGSKDYFQAL